METAFIPLCAIIAVLIIAFLFASLPQASLKTQYKVLYAIAIIMPFAIQTNAEPNLLELC